MKITEIFDKINSSVGNDKTVVMQQNLNDVIVQMYQDCYDPDRKYGLHKLNIISTGTKTVDDDYDEFHDLLDKLAEKELTGNAAIDAASALINQFTQQDQSLLKDILNKKFTIGFSAKSLEKLIDKPLFDKFVVTLACHLEKVKGVNPIDGTWFASRKCDGCVSGDTIVEFENGVKLPISAVVENRMKGKIKSYDENTNDIVYSEITDWMHNIEDVNSSQKNWYELELENGYKLKITGNDSVYVKNKGWVKVENLTEQDEVLIE